MNPTPQSRNPNLGLLATLFLAIFHLPSPIFAADSPLYIPFQGQVTNQAGAIVADGQYSVIFNLYDQAVGGQPVWSERHVKIGVNRGMINVFLGSIAPFDRGTPSAADDVDFSQIKYLGITVDTDNLATTADPEMVPRSLIIPAFHAKKAENSTKLAGFDWSSILTGGANDPSNGTIRGDKLADASVSGVKIGMSAITNVNLASNSVQSAQILDGAVSNSKISDSTITGAKLADASIGLAKLLPRTVVSPAFPTAAPSGTVAVGNLLNQSWATGNTGGPVTQQVSNSNIKILATGRPMIIALMGGQLSQYLGGSNAIGTMTVLVRRSGSPAVTVGSSRWHSHPAVGAGGSAVPIAILCIDTPPEGEVEYRLELTYDTNASNTLSIENCKLAVFELP